MSNTEFVTQFTEDVIAQEDRPCGRTTCAFGGIIKKGQPSIYVASIDSARPGRFVCAGCFQRILQSSSTFTRSANSAGAHAQQTGTSVNMSNITAIHRAVSAAQRKSTVCPVPVMPMPPPSASTEPVIQHPSMRPHVDAMPTASSSSQCYGPQHAMYGQARQYWSNKAYNIPPRPAAPPRRVLPPASGPLPSPVPLALVPQTITLNITALHEGSGGSRKSRVYGMPFGNICEGKRGVDANITALDSVTIALDLVVPQIKAFNPRFQWRPKEFVVRDEDWVDLSKHDNPYEGFFYKRCLVQAAGGRKSKGLVFKPQSFTLHVVVPAQQWSEYEAFVDTDQASSSPSPIIPHGRRNTHSYHEPPPSSVSATQSGRPLAEPTPPQVGPACSRRTTGADHDRLFPSTSQAAGSHGSHPNQDATRVDCSSSTTLPRVGETPPITVKRGHVQSSSVSSATTRSPPSKRLVVGAVMTVPIQPCSPDRDRLCDALQSGGNANLNVTGVMKFKRELVEFYPIPTFSIKDILDDPEKHAFNVGGATVFPGQLCMDVTEASLIGWGGFKTTQAAQLMLGTLRPSGIGSQVCQDIAVKRFYIPPPRTEPEVSEDATKPSHPLDESPPANEAKKPKRFNRFTIADELDKLYREANILYWAKSLFQLMYDFIDRAIGKATSTPPFNIPRLRFVDAGLLLAVKSSSMKAPSAVNVQTPYLAEELIPRNEPFVKYIHNGDPTPIPEPYEPGYDIAQFLAFTQHVQYAKTGGLAYISDYQGSGILLTDPQILTHPTVSAGKDLFGEGNLEIGVKLFATEHVCNHFCRWPGFKLAPLGSVLDNSN